jgi:hypothetical protein
MASSPLTPDQPLSRRAWFAAVVSGAGLLAAACTAGSSQVLDTPDGQVLQYEGDDLLILVSGLRKSYHAGDQTQLNLLVNNQGTGFVQIKLRTKVLGRGDQPVVQPEPIMLEVKSDDATSSDQAFVLPPDLLPGDYNLAVEVPPWKLDGREFGVGATLRAPFRLDAAASG